MQARMPIIVPDFSAGCILPYNIEIEVEVLTTTIVENVGARDPAPPTPPASPPASRSLEIAEASDPIALTASSSDAADLSSSPSMSTVSTTPASIAMYPLLVPGAPTPILPAPLPPITEGAWSRVARLRAPRAWTRRLPEVASTAACVCQCPFDKCPSWLTYVAGLAVAFANFKRSPHTCDACAPVVAGNRRASGRVW